VGEFVGYNARDVADIWPYSAFEHALSTPDEPLRPFRCVLLMPFHSTRFERVADFLKELVTAGANQFLPTLQVGAPVIERVDWVNSSGAIQHQIWERIANADLVFCDLTGQNANVMFEAGVCAARKRIEQVIFLRDEYYRFDQPFDIAPFRYVTYAMTSDGVPRFAEKLQHFLLDVLIGFPDGRGSLPTTRLPLALDFSDNRDDERVVTPPFAHRRVRDGWFEFGSLWAFPNSWATIGKLRLADFALSFTARFAQLHPDKDQGYIGVGLRSQHFYAPYGHILYLNRDGSILLTQPDESSNGYHDVPLRKATKIDPFAEHSFQCTFTGSVLSIRVDDFTKDFPVSKMPKVLGPGMVRLQAHVAWMGISRLTLTPPPPAPSGAARRVGKRSAAPRTRANTKRVHA
jgi:hypothetical protein